MNSHYPKDGQHGDAGPGTTAAQQTEAGQGDSCRCKETSQMTPRELLKLMIRDLSFWKKQDKK